MPSGARAASGRFRVLVTGLDGLWLSLLGVWAASAAVALRSPQRLPGPFLSMSGLPRTDTTGFVAFGASCLLYLASRTLQRRAPRTPLVRCLGGAVPGSMVLYGSLGCGYIIACQVAAPWTLSWPLTHLLPGPTESQFGVLCFLVASAGLATMLMTRRAASE